MPSGGTIQTVWVKVSGAAKRILHNLSYNYTFPKTIQPILAGTLSAAVEHNMYF